MAVSARDWGTDWTYGGSGQLDEHLEGRGVLNWVMHGDTEGFGVGSVVERFRDVVDKKLDGAGSDCLQRFALDRSRSSCGLWPEAARIVMENRGWRRWAVGNFHPHVTCLLVAEVRGTIR